MPSRHPRPGALLLGLALMMTASPAAASTEQPAPPAPAEETTAEPTVEEGAEPAQPTAPPTAQSQAVRPSASSLQPTQHQATAKRLRLTGPAQFGSGPGIRPGDEASFGVTVHNDGQQREEFVVTFTLPLELTLISLGSGDAGRIDCSGNVCRGTIEPGASIENQTARTVEGRVRLSSSFRGDSTTLRVDLQEDANPDPNERTGTLTFAVQQPASGGAAPAPSGTPGTGGAGNTKTAIGALPRTGEHTTITALLALAMLILGGMAQVAGTRRPAAHGG